MPTAAQRTTRMTQTPAPAPKTAFQVGKFNFTIRTGVAIPKDLPKEPNPNALPFREMFDNMPHESELYVPSSFWTGDKSEGGRAVAADKVTVSYVKGKLRDQFKDWKTKGVNGNRDDYLLTLVARKAGQPMSDDGKETYPEDGMSLFLTWPEKLRPKAK